jgi:hypothetical protein
MHFHIQSRTEVLIAAVLAAVFCQYALGQEAQSNAAKTNAPPSSAPRTIEPSKGVPPRATPNDYLAHAQSGKYTIAAEFDGHSVPDPQSILTNENYVVVEVGFFGPPDARLALSYTDFSLRINGKKTPYPAQGFELVFKDLKDPGYDGPGSADANKANANSSKTTVNTNGSADKNNPDPNYLPALVHIPIAITRGWEQTVRKDSLPEGERPLPVAGLIYFEHRGKVNSVELIYNGPAGKIKIPLQP